jgi:predicted nucleic acid-binding protein
MGRQRYDRFLDTQVLSYAYKGDASVPRMRCAISSVTANEFLLVQCQKPARANYYVRWGRSARHPSAHAVDRPLKAMTGFTGRIRERPYPKSATDSLHITFGGQFPDIIEYNSLSLSSAINTGNAHLFSSSVSFLRKELAKLLIRRFKFLVACRTLCVPLTRTEVELGFTLLERFIDHYTVKDDFRNTWNDILILATAISRHGTLITKDSVLSRFAASMFDATATECGSFLSFRFAADEPQGRVPKLESKGYINQSWRVFERNRRCAANA